MSVAQRFNGKRLLITGTTGFLGKVLLEKFLFSVSSVDKIYVLIRGKEGSSLQERFKKQIISSASFDRIRNLHGHHFEEFIHSKVQPMYSICYSEKAIYKRIVLDYLKQIMMKSLIIAKLSSIALLAQTSTLESMKPLTVTFEDH